MSEMKFTPGPWHYGDEDESVLGVHYVDVHAGEYCTDTYRCIASAEGAFRNGDFQPLDEESRANACLIAAAPELYAALSDIMENPQFQTAIGGNPIRVEELMIRAASALAKARGEA